MRNFQLIANNIGIMPLLARVIQNPELWNYTKVRTGHTQSLHQVVDDIVLRFNEYSPGDDPLDKIHSEVMVVNYPAFDMLPEARPMCMALMGLVGGEHLGRVFISRLAPGKEIPQHTDLVAEAIEKFPNRIPPAIYYQRYHIILKSDPGVVFQCGDEQAQMRPGDVWWFNNRLPHAVANHSGDDRIALVVDIAPYVCGYQPEV